MVLVGVFHDIFQVCLWGVKEEEGRLMGMYTYVVNDVPSEISFPCKPVSLFYHVCISAHHPAFLRPLQCRQSQPIC